MDIFVAVDIGGTHIRAATYEENNPLPLTHQRAHSLAQQPGTFDRLVKTIEAAWPSHQSVRAIGVASPGPLDPQTGVVLATPNIPEWRNFPVAEKLSQHFGVPAWLDNDANLAALGEWKFGAGRGHHHILYLTISTGVGGGVVIHDHLLHGHHGMAAELGHVTVLAGGPLCSCGHHGHLEALASGPAIERYVREQLTAGAASKLRDVPELNARVIAEAATHGDELAKLAYARAGEYLGISVAGFLHTFNPSIVILGGGVSLSGPLLFEPFEASLRKHVFHPRYLEGLTIAPAALGDNAGLLGAFTLAMLNSQRTNN
ncbi:MAG: ROK family protein [Anaerolineales bacterium]